MEPVKHEACQEYFRRRLSEGWKCISLDGYNAVLLSPEGIRRKIDLRNDVETLRPNAPGDNCTIEFQTGCPGCPNHYQCVDDVAPDTGTYVSGSGLHTSFNLDLYNIPNFAGTGEINKITLYFRVRCSFDGQRIKGAIKSNGTTTYTAEKDPFSDFGDNVWGTYNQIWAQNPVGPAAWQWADIDALQIGIALEGSTDCTQVYVEIDYTPAAAGIGNKSANMGSKMLSAGII